MYVGMLERSRYRYIHTNITHCDFESTEHAFMRDDRNHDAAPVPMAQPIDDSVCRLRTTLLDVIAELRAWLQEGAHFYVCGDASRMAKDVDAALRSVAARHGE
jgi:hypothetical protein